MTTRDPAIPVWPRCLVPQGIAWGLTRPVMTGPQTLSGRPQTVMSDMGAWRVTLTGIRLADIGERIRTFRALFFGTLALGQPVYLPLYDWRRGARLRTGLPAFPGGVPFSDTSRFSDGTEFDGDMPTLIIAIAAAQRAGQITVVQAAGGDPLPTAGEYIGLGERAYLVTAIFAGQPSAGQTTLKIQPPLRSAAAIGDPVEIADPVCRMQLDPKSVETMVALDLRSSALSLSTFTRPTGHDRFFWSAAVEAHLAGATVGVAYGVEFFFASGTKALWPGQGAFDTSALGGPVFQGIGGMGQVGAVEMGAVAATQPVSFSLSGLDAALFAVAQNQGAEVRGRRAKLYLIFFDVQTFALIDVRVRRTLVMDRLPAKIDGASDPPSMVLSLTTEPILATKNRAPYAFLTDADQRGRYPGDRGLERMQELTNNQSLVWTATK